MQAEHLYEFGRFRLDQQSRLLTTDGAAVPLSPKAFETLLVLIERRGNVVEKTELMRLVWPDAFVEEVGLTRNISVLRKAFGDDPANPEYIETIPKHGYRFIADVQVVEVNVTEKLDHAHQGIEDKSGGEFLAQVNPLTDSAVTLPKQIKSDPRAWPAGLRKRKIPSFSSQRVLTASALFLIVVGLIAGFSYLSWKSRMAQAGSNFDNPSISKLTGTGKVKEAAISPDG